MGVLFPIGIVLWFRIWRFRLRLWRDLQQTKKQCLYIMERLKIEN
jgi:lipopolysaccharide export system permease protein